MGEKMQNKIKNMLQYYSDMMASVNYHSKNGATNANIIKKDVKLINNTLKNLEKSNKSNNASLIRLLKSQNENMTINNSKLSELLDVQCEYIANNDKFDTLLKGQSIDMQNKESLEVMNTSREMKFSIVTAAYNSERYLPDYFLSIVKQKDFDVENDLEIIIVDDGSIDNTAGIVNTWIENSNLNIKYIYQKNKGQSEARNEGLKAISNEWVTFIDSDDFISDNYFYNIKKNIIKYDEDLYVLPWEFYFEDDASRKREHPLNWRFDKTQLIDIEKRPEYINLSVSSAVFKTMYIKIFDLKFKEIKPNFEDAEFYLNYVSKVNVKNVCFINDVKYFYRKRSDETSTIDLSKKDPVRFLNLLNNGYIKSLENHPNHLTKLTILYDLRWNIEGFNNELKILGDIVDLDERINLIDQIMDYYELEDLKEALDKKLIGLNFYKIMSAHYFDNYTSDDVKIQYFYETKDFLMLKFECLESQIGEVKINTGDEIYSPLDFEFRYKDIYATKLESIMEYIVYIPKTLKIESISYSEENLEITKINTKYKKKHFNSESTLLFFDRADTADDNAEHLYRWFKENKKEYKNIYFVLKKDAKDWSRLSDEGFNMVDYDSQEFDDLYCNGDFIFSSGGDSGSIENYKRYRYFWYKSSIKFIFLQHGITKDNIKNWLMSKRYDQMFTTMTKEYEFVKNEVFNDKTVQNVGLSRYDNLMKLETYKKKVLIFLTWRGYLPVNDKKKLRETTYYKNLVKLSKIQKSLNEEVLVILHPNMKDIYNQISKDMGGVEVQMIQEIKIQEELAQAKVLITDYSSIAFDAAYINKPVIYYQFDKEEFFGNHTYDENPNLFSYENDAFGDLVYTEEELVNSLRTLKMNNFKLDSLYQRRKDLAFGDTTESASEKIFSFMINEYK